MKLRQGAFLSIAVVALSLPTTSQAFELPAIRSSERNAVPACVTPGRLMAFLKARNPNLEPKFEKLAVEYMRHGEELGLRWDIAFFQMAIETSYLTFMRDERRPGDVKSSQNNFAGLGATGKGERGESFKTVPDGVRAHLQHVLMYTGETIEDPVAERTRKIQEWGVLTSWRSKIKGPMTFEQLAKRWANTREYAEAIASHAERFFDHHCNVPDPAPELVALARSGRVFVADKPAPREDKAGRKEEPPTAATAERVSGAELARRALEEGRAEGARRTGLGAGALIARASEPLGSANDTGVDRPTASSPAGSPAVIATSAAASLPKSAPATPAKPAATAPTAPPKAATTRCKVFTASYGGVRAILIKSVLENVTTFTVLDVNDGNEKREAEAYIAAYARGGTSIGDFDSPATALDKAFELCPEG